MNDLKIVIGIYIFRRRILLESQLLKGRFFINRKGFSTFIEIFLWTAIHKSND